jgi:hypothetical protein
MGRVQEGVLQVFVSVGGGLYRIMGLGTTNARRLKLSAEMRPND